MTVPASTIPDTVASTAPEPQLVPVLSSAEIDRSCRSAVLFLLSAAAVWLGISALLGVLTAIKAHGPGFLPSPGWLTYGRLRPAGMNAFFYGFVLQAGLGLALWMFCRLGRSLLQGRRMIIAAGVLWNLGLLVGWIGILAGGSTGYLWLEMPREAAPILFVAWVLAGVWALINLHLRTVQPLYVSQWFLLAALLWFPWIYSTAELLLVYFPARGVMQAVVNGWYIHNLYTLCMGSIGLAAIFYFIPKLTGRPLHSAGLALFGFWAWIFFGGWGGGRYGEPVPSWISGVNTVAQVFLLLPAAAFAIGWFRTVGPIRSVMKSDLILRFILVAAASFILAALLETAGSYPLISSLTLFTLYGEGVTQLKIHGFLAMALAGAFYYIAPRVAGCEWPSTRLIRVHFWSAVAGALVTVLALLIGGLIQGAGINHPETDFMRVVRRTVPFLGMNSLGATLLLVGYAAFIVNLSRLLAAGCAGSVSWTRLKELRAAPLAATAGRASR